MVVLVAVLQSQHATTNVVVVMDAFRGIVKLVSGYAAAAADLSEHGTCSGAYCGHLLGLNCELFS